MTPLLATGFVVDGAAEGSLFPSAGGNSADPRVQAVYWRCLAMFFASARITNPDLRLALFTNAEPPEVDGVQIGALLDRYGVELRRVPLTARLSGDQAKAWGNVLYFLDIMDALGSEAADQRLAITDSDVLITGSLAPLFGLLDHHDFAGYVVEETRADEDVNGMTQQDMTKSARLLGAEGEGLVPHFGGELFMATPAQWATLRETMHGLLADARAGAGPGAKVRTEEHMYSIAFALPQARVARANAVMKRIWTSPRFNTARAGDEALPLWHLPAEKRYGLRDMFNHFRKLDFPVTMDSAEFHALAMRLCGIPAKSPAKLLRDGLFQIAAKLGCQR